MTSEMVLARTRVLDADEAHHLGSLLAASGYFEDAADAAKAAVKVMAGAELGVGPVASMRGVDIIKGEVSLSAGLCAALVRGSERYDYEIASWTDEGCTLVFSRDGRALDPPISFGNADAVRAGLAGGDNYRKWPRAMYFARAMTIGARAHCPDLFSGSVYAPGEIEGARNASEAPGSAAPPLSAPATLDEAILRGEVVGLDPVEAPETPPAASQAEDDQPDIPPAPEPSAATEGPKTGTSGGPAALAAQLGIPEAAQRLILLTIGGLDDATDLQAAYRSLPVDRRDAVAEALAQRAQGR